MKQRPICAAILATTVIGLSVVVATQAVQAANLPRTDAQLVAPSVRDGDLAFYTADQIDEVWAAVVANYPAELPVGYTFEKKAPAFFHPTDVKDPLFEAGLPDMIAAQYWRCAWLDARINHASTSVSAARLDSALDVYWSLPSVDGYDNASRLSAEVLARVARENGLPDNDHALYALDCEGLEK